MVRSFKAVALPAKKERLAARIVPKMLEASKAVMPMPR
jgi:hypothetical protein